MAGISVPRPGTKRIPCEARDFVYIRILIKTNGSGNTTADRPKIKA
jgi:hypothetical protein